MWCVMCEEWCVMCEEWCVVCEVSRVGGVSFFQRCKECIEVCGRMDQKEEKETKVMLTNVCVCVCAHFADKEEKGRCGWLCEEERDSRCCICW